jgi:hypothetical protein
MEENEGGANAWKGENLPHSGEAEPREAFFAPFGARAIPDGARQSWLKPGDGARHFVLDKIKLFNFSGL